MTEPRKRTPLEIISDEISSQLVVNNVRLKNEFNRDMQAMKETITWDVIAQVEPLVKTEVELAIRLAMHARSSDMQSGSAQTQTTSTELLDISKIETTVFNNILTEFNKDIIPRIHSMIDHVNYGLQDGNLIVDDYRRQVDKKLNTPSITDGTQTDTKFIREGVSLFFGDDEYQ